MRSPTASVSGRIALFLPSLTGGGAERMTLNLARGLGELGQPTDLVVASAEGAFRSLVPADTRLIDLRAKRVLAALPGLIRYLATERPMAMLSAMDHANMIALWARALSHAPTRLYVSVRSTLTVEAQRSSRLGDRLMPRLARRFYPRAERVVAVSHGVAEDLVDRIGVPAAKVTVLPNPVVTPDLFALSAETPNHPWLRDPLRPFLLAVGRLVPQKDFATLLQAFALVARRWDGGLIILGEGPERPRLVAASRTLGLAGRVDLPGFDSNPFAYMSKAHLFVLSSAWEGLPGVLIQAMACGTPVVSTDCPSGPAEILEGGRLGPLVPIGNPEQLAEAILTTLAHPTPRTALVAKATEYSLTEVSRRYQALLAPARAGMPSRPDGLASPSTEPVPSRPASGPSEHPSGP